VPVPFLPGRGMQRIEERPVAVLGGDRERDGDNGRIDRAAIRKPRLRTGARFRDDLWVVSRVAQHLEKRRAQELQLVTLAEPWRPAELARAGRVQVVDPAAVQRQLIFTEELLVAHLAGHR